MEDTATTITIIIAANLPIIHCLVHQELRSEEVRIDTTITTMDSLEILIVQLLVKRQMMMLLISFKGLAVRLGRMQRW